jgi:hypothetical protein|tara:strand:- start:1546 stop:2007 length:462 start_codon:yes stop_codon:yes gene_type:complete
MATTTSTLSLTSPDLTDDTLALNVSKICYKGGTTVGLDQTTGLTRAYLTATTSIDIFPAVKDATNIAETGKVYIANLSEDETEYIIVSLANSVIGRLYAGDFLWMPWTPQASLLSDIEIAPSVATGMVVEYMAVHNFANISMTSSDTRVYTDA